MANSVEYGLLWGNKKIINKTMIKDFLIINCTGKNDQVGLRIDNNFFIYDFQTKFQNNELLAQTIVNFITKHKVNIDENFSVLINYGPGRFSSIRASLSIAKGIKISKNVKLFGYKGKDLPQFNLENIENLINKDLLEKNLIKPIYLS